MADSENKIKSARLDVGMTIKEMAEYLGAPYRTVQDWNSGARKPPEWVANLIIEKMKDASQR